MTAGPAKSLDEFEVPGLEVIQDPRPFYRALHAQAPLFRPKGQDFYIVSRYADVKQIMKDTKTFSNSWYAAVTSPHPEVAAILAQGCPRKDVLPTADPPEHRRYRKLVEKAFTFARVQRMRPYIQSLIDELIDGFIDDGSVDFVDRFAVKLPISIIADLLAVPRSDIDDFKRWSDGALVPMSRTASLEIRKASAYMKLEMQRYVLSMLEDRRRNPGDDFPSALATASFEDEVDEAGRPRLLSGPEFIQIVESFIVAGNETSTAALGAGMLKLIEQPDLVGRLRAAPELLPAFVEEVLRLEAPIQGQPRLVKEDTVLHGVSLAAGTILDIRLGAANMDPEQFEDPTAIRLDRENANAHMTFGSGIHFCVGAALVRQELPMAFGTIIDRMANFRLTRRAPPTYVNTFMNRTLSALHMSFDQR